MDVTPILDPLNTAQRDAVTCDAPHLLVLAGAGSGKTRVLVHRMAWLIDVESVSPQGLLAVTFTNKAAREMRERIETLLGLSTRGMWVGTFHGLAHRLLKAHHQEAGLPAEFQILDSDDQLRQVKRAIAALGLDEARWPGRQAQGFINAQKDEGLRAHQVIDNGDRYLETQKRIYATYEEACQRSGLVDFGELLLRSHELWLKDPSLLGHYQQRFRHILVDEFQDTNTIQYSWLRILAGDSARLTVVGDDDQSIYGWRGAKIENIQEFCRDYPDAVTVRLEQNYRSTGIILQAANAVISRNHSRLGKSLWTEGPEGEPISLFAAFNELDEARFIAEYLQRWADRGNLYREAAVLYRSNAQSRVLEEALIRLGIPYRIYGGQRFYERLEIRNALAYLRLLRNRDDDAAFERVVNTPTRGIGARTLDAVRQCARERRLSLWTASLALIDENLLASRASGALYGFVRLINALDEETRELELAELVDHVLARSGLVDFHRAEKGERGQARVENLDELVSACRVFEPEDPKADPLTQFLAEAALDAGEQQADADADAVQLMTLHSAKGLEFPLVMLSGLEENLFPHAMSVEEPGRLEEERRLCYVGITRAQQKLVLSYAEARRLHGDERYNAISRFVRDIPGELVEEIRVGTASQRSTATAVRGFSMSDPGIDTGLSLGERVHHPTFGEGTVLNFEGQGAHARVQVNFDREGAKWLVLSFARLEPVR